MVVEMVEKVVVEMGYLVEREEEEVVWWCCCCWNDGGDGGEKGEGVGGGERWRWWVVMAGQEGKLGWLPLVTCCWRR